MPGPISLKMFMDASPISNADATKGDVTLAVNAAGVLRPLAAGAAPKEEVRARTLQAFLGALEKDFGAHVAQASSQLFKADLANNRPLTARLVQQIVHSAKELITFNATVRNGFLMPDHTGESDFDRAFDARLTHELKDKIHPELQKEIKSRLMTEFLQHFQSKSAQSFTVEAMHLYVAHASPLMLAVETACTEGTAVPAFTSGSSTLLAHLDQQGKLVLSEAGQPKDANPVLQDPSPGIADPKEAFAHFLRTTPRLSGFSPAQAEKFKTELTAEFKTHLEKCNTPAEARAMVTKFANDQLTSRTLGILKTLSSNPCRGFAGSLDDKADIARALYTPAGDKLGMDVAIERLADIRKLVPRGPITKEAIWQGIFNEPMPKKLEGSFIQAFIQKLLPRMCETPVRSSSLTLVHNLISSNDIPTLLNKPHLPVTEKNLHTRNGLSVNAAFVGVEAMAADLFRRGGNNAVPSTINVGDMTLTVGPNPKLGTEPFVFSGANGLNKHTLGINTEVAVHLSETIDNYIGRGGHASQRELVKTLCSQSGLLPLTRMRGSLGFHLHEHSASTITITKTDSGAVRVNIATPKNMPGADAHLTYEAQHGSIDINWLVEPDGKLSLERLTIVRAGADAEQRPADPPSVEDVVRNRIATQASGLSAETRSELANLVMASVKSKTGRIPDPMNPSVHPGPLMRLLDGVRSGLFTGPNATDNYAIMQRFPSNTFPLGLLLDAATRARAEQPEGEISRETLWAKMYPDFQFLPCGSDAEMVKHMENMLPSFVRDQADMIVFEKSKATRESGQAALSEVETQKATSEMTRRLMQTLDIMPLTVAIEFMNHPHELRKEHLLAPNMAAFPGFQYDAQEQLAKDINRRGILDGGTPTLHINNSTFTLGSAPRRNAETDFPEKTDPAVYKSGKPTLFSRELAGEIRILCGGQQASQPQVDTVTRCCAQCGSTAFRMLAGAGLNFDEHSSTNIAVSAEPDGNMRVHISTLPEQANRGSIAYSILVDRDGCTRVDDFTATPAGVK